MRHGLFFLSLPLLTILVSPLCYSNPPINLSTQQKVWVQFNQTGAYAQTVKQECAAAEHYLQHRIALNNASLHRQQLAIVMAVNNTALNHYPTLLETHFSDHPNAVMEAEAQGNEPAITPVKKLYDTARQNKVNVFFISNRRSQQRSSTLANLNRVGYTEQQGLYLLPQNSSDQAFKSFATSQRAQITKQHNRIVLNISANQEGLEGGYADKTILLPSYHNRIISTQIK